jgi:hypothetical protein
MKSFYIVALISSMFSLSGMEKDAFIPSVYRVDHEQLNNITKEEIIRRISKEKIDKGVEKYIRSRHSGCSKEEEDQYIQKVKEKAIENRIKKSILTYLRQNMYVSTIEESRGEMLEDNQRWQYVVDQINFGILVFDEKGRLIKA